MAEQKESSVLFSLKELMTLEENRIQEEEAEKARTAREQAEARAAQERASREEEARRLQEEEDRRRQEELRKREEEARVEAIRHGEIEKARTEAEHRARMEAMASQQAHAQQLAALDSDQTKKRLKLIVGIVSAVLVLGGIGIAVLWSGAEEEKAKREQVLLAQQRESEQQLARLKAEFDAAQEKQDELRRSLESAKDEATRAQLEAELAKARKETERARGAVGGGPRPAAKPKKAAKPCDCPPGDPLCSCL